MTTTRNYSDARSPDIQAKALPIALVIALGTFADSASAQGLALEEIIVTAQKKIESVQDIPATINPITSEDVKKYSIFEIDQIGPLTPGLTFARPDSRKQSFTIRGITADPDNNATAPITPYWNEIPIRPQELFTALFDMQRIEVLRGPQGTLRGRTDPSGSILVYTEKPNLSYTDGYVQQSFSDHRGANTQFAASMPLVENRLAIRFAGLYDENEGQQVKNIVNGQKEHSRQKGGRLSVTWLPLENLQADLVYQYLEMDVESPEPVAGRPGRAATDGFYQALVAGGTGTYYPEGFRIKQRDRRAIHAGESRTLTRSELTSLGLEWDLGSHVLTSVTGYKNYSSQDVRDMDVANFEPGAQASTTTTDIEGWTQEFRLANSDNDFWEYNIGLYWEKQRVKAVNHIDVLNSYTIYAPVWDPATDGPLPQSADLWLDIPLDTDIAAAFWHNKFYLTDSLSLQAGIRWQESRRKSLADALGLVDGDPSLGAAYGLPSGPLIQHKQSRQNEEAWTGTLKLSYMLTPDVMVYGGYDRSFRPSGVSISGDTLSGDSLTFGSESSDNIELGIKTTLADGRVRLNAAVFYQQFNDYQAYSSVIRANIPRSGNIGDETEVESLTFNADARVRGFEADFEALLSERWMIAGGYTHIDSRFRGGEEGPCNASPIPAGQELAFCRIGGNRISAQPLWSATLNSEYFVPLAGMEWYLRGIYSYTDRSVDEQVHGESISAHGLLNLWTGIRSTDQRWDVSLWVKNATDENKKALSANTIAVSSLGFDSDFRRAVMIAPRTVGLTGRYNF